MWRPVRMVSVKLRCVHLPSPVSRSGVRFAVKLTPHGPAQAVLVAANAATHGASSFGAGGSVMPSGWPDSARVMSGSGPFSPITHGVWQSWHAEVLTRYLPRATLSAVVPAFVCAFAGKATATVAATARP